ncbi:MULTISPECIES: hypothetical protein [Enterococcus]|uniref:hypothetical protein n=1 Tax=Enterococcus TaxID=1350 RepID=UPI00164F0C61|nr:MULTISPECIES: hypothetical protein [Enterococcus]MBJ0564753.1 hypothetical protein [Enterococcus faecium]MBJ0591649.1 hypothetical protein [Enterococcus faecium]MBJ0606472.1 hypothetical protein [Enterococcus faecium]MBJ0639848.1 hypothetical protein [Enterococcus faecium]MBJ0688209.1 hypothetical protein [Enterococcus faecium]
MIIVSSFLRWLTPYKYTDEVVVKRAKKKDKKAVLTPKQMLDHGILGVKVLEVNKPFESNSAREKLLGAEADVAYFYHDKSKHQIAIKFNPKSSWRYQARDDLKRRKLRPMLYPEGKEAFDRTHIVPIGFHGTESDNRLLVGWNSNQNRVQINKFEKKVRKFNDRKTILWFADICKQPDGTAKWEAVIFDENGKKVMSETWHDKAKFVWQ